MSSPDGSTVTFRRAAADVRPRAIAAFARKLEREVAKGCAFDVLITGDAELRKLNRQFRRRDYATDVLSFPSGAGLRRARGSGIGDLAISLARARTQAKEYGHTTEREICILMLHGLLHLLGFDHESDDGRMARAEKRWRRELRLPNSLIERVSA